MTPKEAHDEYGAEWAEAVAKAAGTTYGYYVQIMYRYARPSIELANRLCLHSEGCLDFVSLVRYKPRRRR